MSVMKKTDYIAELHDVIELFKARRISEYEASACSFALGALHWAEQLENAADITVPEAKTN